MSIFIEDSLPVVKYEGLNCAKNVVLTGTTVTLPASTTIGGSTVSALGVITSASATALSVGLNGATNPAFNVDSSTGSQAAGLNVVGATTAGTVAIASVSSGAAAGLSVNSKGTGVLNIQGTATGQISIGRGPKARFLTASTSTTLDAQSGTAAIAELLGGVYLHNSKTGAGTLTTPTGTEISAGIAGVATGDTFDTLYVNYGNQTVTLTAGASGVTITGTAAITTGKNALLRFVCTGANTWICYVLFSA
jgi:hypothetical protein